MKSKSSLLLICAALFLASAFIAGCQSDSEELRLFQKSRQIVHAGRFTEGIKVFKMFDECYPESRFASRSAFLTAKCHFGLGDLDLAKQAFDRTIENFPDSLEAKKSGYKLAVIDFFEGNAESGKEKLIKIASGPAHPYMPEVVATLRVLEEENP